MRPRAPRGGSQLFPEARPPAARLKQTNKLKQTKFFVVCCLFDDCCLFIVVVVVVIVLFFCFWLTSPSDWRRLKSRFAPQCRKLVSAETHQHRAAEQRKTHDSKISLGSRGQRAPQTVHVYHGVLPPRALSAVCRHSSGRPVVLGDLLTESRRDRYP